MDAMGYHQAEQRKALIAAGRALTIDGTAPHTQITEGDHFYVVSFSGRADKPVLSKSGVYRGFSLIRGDALSGTNPRRSLASVVWDGDQKVSRHVAGRIGLSFVSADAQDASNVDPQILALGSLEGVDVIDQRPLPQRRAHPAA